MHAESRADFVADRWLESIVRHGRIAVAAVVVAKWEGDLDSPEPPEIEPPHAPTSHVH